MLTISAGEGRAPSGNDAEPEGHTMLMQPGRRARGQGGMTLIELLVATVILTTGVLGLSIVSVTTNELRASGLEKAAALHAVERELAAVEATDFANIVLTHNGRGFSVSLPGEANTALRALTADADGLPGIITITAPTGDPAHLLEIHVRIIWQGRHGSQQLSRTFRLSSLGSSS
jgi:prepilin-type N-terminal cleavage/methylation domain-containing protein